MREILFKNLLSSNKKRKELFMFEHVETLGMIQEYERKFVYTIKEVIEYRDKKELEQYINEKLIHEADPQTYIIKSSDTRERKWRTIYKICEIQYVVLKDKIVVLKLTQNIQKTIILTDEGVLLGD